MLALLPDSWDGMPVAHQNVRRALHNFVSGDRSAVARYQEVWTEGVALYLHQLSERQGRMCKFYLVQDFAGASTAALISAGILQEETGRSPEV